MFVSDFVALEVALPAVVEGVAGRDPVPLGPLVDDAWRHVLGSWQGGELGPAPTGGSAPPTVAVGPVHYRHRCAVAPLAWFDGPVWCPTFDGDLQVFRLARTRSRLALAGACRWPAPVAESRRAGAAAEVVTSLALRRLLVGWSAAIEQAMAIPPWPAVARAGSGTLRP